jgi:scyllo-inositol 2-dehydrogenase (NADP+)
MADQQMIGVGIIGYGMATKVFHRPLIESVEGLKIVGVLRRSAAETTDIPLVTDLADFLALPGLQLAVITTPNESHFPLAKACLEAGKAVVVDKPFTVTAREGEELVALARKKNLPLTVFHNRRYDGDFLVIQHLLRDRTLGRLVSFESTFDRFRPELRPGAWREGSNPGAGILYDLGPHLIDQAFMLFGKPEAVFAQVRCERDGSVIDDAFDLSLMYKELKVLLRASMLAPVPRPRFLLQGTKGSYVKYDLDEQERLLKSGVRPLDPNWNKAQNQPGKIVLERDQQVVTSELPTPLGDYRRFYVNVRDALLTKSKLDIPAEAGVESVRIIEAAFESSRRQQVIRV